MQNAVAAPQVTHIPNATELLDLFTVALQYLVDGQEPGNAPAILRAHRALDQAFERGRRQGFQEGNDAAHRNAAEEAQAAIDRFQRAR